MTQLPSPIKSPAPGVYRGVSKQGKNTFKETISNSITGTKYLGAFQSPEEAAKAWDKEAKATYGEFAVLNFPEQDSNGA